ncbi:nuclear transport factor 2 family protein [Streptomyces sp. NBC_01259]|uniref:nuclear transport factor 2 family protein n=1 Tax=Streptomyces sp. NBC_01259 TaxID=2903800 RepID=UPI003251E506
MTGTDERELLVIVERFFAAYNDMDLDSFANLLAEDIRWGHHNRFRGAGAAPLLRSIQEIHDKLPDRRFGEITRWAASDHTIYAEHSWTGTPAESDAAWGWQAGVPASMECVSVFVIEGGRVTEWSDYG